MAEKDFRVRKGLVVDGTSSATSVEVTTGNVVVTDGTLGLTNGILLSTVSGTPNVSKITSQPTNGNIHIEPNGSGDIVLVTDNLDVSGDSMKISIKNNVAAGLDITEAGNSYIKLVTTNSSEQIVFGQDSTFASTTIANLGTVSAATSITSTAFVGPIDGIVGGNTPAAGTFTGISLGEGNITNVGDINADSISVDAAGTGLNVDFSGADTGTAKITLNDGVADALSITDGSADFMVFNTTAETITFGKNSTFASTTIANLGTVTTANIDGGTLDGVTIGGAAQAAATVTTLTATGNVQAGSGNTGELRTTAGILQDNVTANHKILTVDGTNFYTSETLSVTEVSNRSKTPGGGFGTNADGIGKVVVLALNIENASNDLFQAAEAFCAMSIKNSSGTIQKRVISKVIGHLNADGGIETTVTHHSGNTTLGNFRWAFHEDPTGSSGNNHMTLIFEYTARHDHTNGSADVTTYSVNVNGLSLSGAGG
tara:strand:- start:2321 stop:3775 length:1455 start_codon:yes stop_codon:yes gene_type:complete